MTRVLHISADYPDAFQPGKTRAIANLVEATGGQLDHLVYSLNRVNGWQGWVQPGGTAIVDAAPGLVTLRYHAPRWGLMLARSMDAVAAAIAADLAARKFDPDVIHGHKLSFEGLAAHALARRLSKPFVISLQGNTDQKVISARRDLHRRYQAVWHEAAHVFPFSPWIERWCQDRFGTRRGPTSLLPCIAASERILAPSENADTVCTAFNLDFWKNKNLQALVEAITIASRVVPGLKFKIAGAGSAEATAHVRRLVETAGLADITTLSGRIPPEQIQAWMNDAAVFALPSRRETFGMVFIEALLAGTPIIYPKGTAVDGYFDDVQFAMPVRAQDPADIAAAISAALHNHRQLKIQQSDWQGRDSVRQFQRTSIAETYCAAIESLAG